MAAVFLTTTAAAGNPLQQWGQSNLKRLQYAATVDRQGKHFVVTNVAAADIVLFVGFVEKYHADIKRSPIVREAPEKCFVYDEQDNTIPSLPGIYTGLPRRTASHPAFRSGFYLRVFDNPHIPFDEDYDACRYLFCFQGTVANAPVRKNILNLRDSRGWLHDASTGQGDFRPEYGDLLRNSKFVLCPRGVGASSWRLFETMRAGRVPVVLSDEWTPPIGPPWHQFSVRLPEDEFHRVPEICKALEGSAPAMGRLARKTWENWFSAEAAFHRIVEWCLSIKYEMQGLNYTIPSIFMPIRTFNRVHFHPYWREFLRSRAVACGVWPDRRK